MSAHRAVLMSMSAHSHRSLFAGQQMAMGCVLWLGQLSLRWQQPSGCQQCLQWSFGCCHWSAVVARMLKMVHQYMITEPAIEVKQSEIGVNVFGILTGIVEICQQAGAWQRLALPICQWSTQYIPCTSPISWVMAPSSTSFLMLDPNLQVLQILLLGIRPDLRRESKAMVSM